MTSNNKDNASKKTMKEIAKDISKRVSEEELRKIIINFLDEHKICTMATCSDNIPRSTPLRYRNKELTIYISTEGGGKMKNIKQNPTVSVSLYADYKGFDSVRSLQTWGTAEIITPDDKDKYLEARKILNTEGREDLKNMNVKNAGFNLRVIKIKIERARYFSFPEGILNQELDLSQ